MGAASHNGKQACFWTQLTSSIPSITEFFSEETIIDFAEVNHGAGLRKVDRDLKMLIALILYWLVASLH